MTPRDQLPLERVPLAKRYAVRAAYRLPVTPEMDADLVAMCGEGTLCCVGEGHGMRTLLFEFTACHLATWGMRRMATVPGIVSLVAFPKGFACDHCVCARKEE